MSKAEYTIKFSHYYNKMKPFDLSRPFTLLLFEWARTNDFPSALVEYDTVYDGGRYILPKGEVIILLLEQDNKLMTTIRRFTPKKAFFYSRLAGKQVMCEVTKREVKK